MALNKLPAGFKPISGIGAGWQPKKPGDSLQGVMGAVKIVKLAAKGKKGKQGYREARDWPIYTVITKDGSQEVGESAGLRSLAQIKKGRPVFIQYLGKKKLGGGRQPMRDFLVATK